MFSHFIGFCPLIQFAKPHVCLFQERSVKIMYFHLSAPTGTDRHNPDIYSWLWTSTSFPLLVPIYWHPFPSTFTASRLE